MPVTGVIFDCDGTLLDSMGAWLAAQNELAHRVGVDLNAEDVDIICALTIPETGDFMHKKFGLGSSGQEVVEMINELMLEYYRTKTQARPGALDFVKELNARGVRCSVASSTPTALLKIGLEEAGFTLYLDTIVSVDEAGASKRKPAVYDLSRERMGTRKQSTWVFEDAVYALRTLKSAGYRSVGIYDNDISGTLDELSIADIVICDFFDLNIDEFIAAADYPSD